MSEVVTFELYEVRRLWPDLMVASATGTRERARQEIEHYAFIYGQDGPVKIREVNSHAPNPCYSPTPVSEEVRK